MIFSFVMPDLKDGEMAKRADWTRIDADVGNATAASGVDGWYIPLRGASAGQLGDEYVTARPVLFGGSVYVATFQEDLISAGDTGECVQSGLAGTSRLYALSLETGGSSMWGGDSPKKYLEFDGIKIVSFTVSEKGENSTLVAAYQVLDQGLANTDINNYTKGEEKEETLSKVDGLDALVVRMSSGGGGRSKVTSNDVVVNYWRFVPLP
jgi:hypothetical protein